MKKICFTFIGVAVSTAMFSQIYLAKTSEISFYSHSPIEDITAVNTAAKPMLNTATGDVQIKIAMAAFRFEKPLMQEHFNENYVESEKYPNAIYKGKINEKVDFTKDGETKVTITGKFNIHGVEKEKTIDGKIIVKGEQIIISSKFNLHVADYNIKVPSLYVTNVAEDVEVKLNATLEKYIAPPKAKIGMTKEEVIKIMGEPEKISETETKQGKTEMLFYDKMKTTINFDVDGKVNYINGNK